MPFPERRRKPIHELGKPVEHHSGPVMMVFLSWIGDRPRWLKLLLAILFLIGSYLTFDRNAHLFHHVWSIGLGLGIVLLIAAVFD